MLWIALMPVEDRGFKFSNKNGDTWLWMKLAEGGEWDLEWVGYDAESNAFRITRRVDSRQGAEITGGTGAFVRLTRLPPGRVLLKEGPRTGKHDLQLEMRSYDRNGKVLFDITPTKHEMSPDQVLQIFGKD